MIDLKLFIDNLGFPNTEIKRNSITVSKTKIKLLSKYKKRWTLFLKRINKDNPDEIVDCYPYLKKISFPNGFDITQILYNGLWLSYQNQIERFLQLKQNKIREIFIDENEEYFKIDNKQLRISLSTLEQVINDARGLQLKAKSHRNSFETYEGNKLLKKYLNITIEGTTLVRKGDFTFLIDRLNLKTKNSKEIFRNTLIKQI